MTCIHKTKLNQCFLFVSIIQLKFGKQVFKQSGLLVQRLPNKDVNLFVSKLTKNYKKKFSKS